MKKLLFLLLAAAAVTACDNDEERNGKQSAVYDGTLIVTDNTKTPPETATSKNLPKATTARSRSPCRESNS